MNIPPPATTVDGLIITTIEDRDIAEVIALWQRCGSTRPWNDPASDIALARKETNSTVLLGRNNGALVASVMVGHDGHRGWVYYVTVDPDRRYEGYGRVIMNAAEEWLRACGILKLQLMVRKDNAQVHAFYQSLGYYNQQTVTFAKWLDGREPTP
ncbi:GNAT family acetyltransferase [Bradyrhizobium sp. CSA112]|uniref:GNAT family acetyltransferase n=1 Tax=Bradyrhizobium sp. CSA112 TaxID=2699170 RepID=UPI0023B10FBF|nr:GNAT family acetyltransferase [Bradyrhizobium sp. CSA112]